MVCFTVYTSGVIICISCGLSVCLTTIQYNTVKAFIAHVQSAAGPIWGHIEVAGDFSVLCLPEYDLYETFCCRTLSGGLWSSYILRRGRTLDVRWMPASCWTLCSRHGLSWLVEARCWPTAGRLSTCPMATPPLACWSMKPSILISAWLCGMSCWADSL